MSPLLTDGFANREKQGGTPSVLFTIAIGTRTWRYAQGGKDVTVAATGLTYKAAHIQVDSDVERAEDIGPQRVSVKIAIRTDVVAALRAQQTEPMWLGIHRYHASVGGAPVRWAFGEIASGRVTRGWYTIELQTEEAALEREVPRAIFAPQCQKTTYSPECGVNADDFAFATNITVIDGRTIDVSSVGGQPDDYFTDGLLKLGTSWFNISKQTGTSLRLFQQLPRGLTLPAAATLYAGDDLTHVTCRDKFNNLDNFLGFNWLPSKNPSLDMEHRGPDILVTTYEAPTSGSYVRPSKFLWHRGDTPDGSPPTDYFYNVLFNGALDIIQWDDVSGNTRHSTESFGRFCPGWAPPINPLSQSPWAESEGIGFGVDHQGVLLPGDKLFRLAMTDDIHTLTACDFYYTLNLAKEDPSDPVELFYITGDGNGQGVTALLPNRVLQVGFGLGGTGRFYIPLPNYAIAGKDVVLNITATPDQYSVRLDNVLIFTTTPNESYYGLQFWYSNFLGGTIGDPDGGYLARRLVMYPSALSKEDRASTFGYMKTGIGSPV